MIFERKTFVTFLSLPMLVLPLMALAPQAETTKQDLDSQIESARADIRADKVAIIKEAMNFTPQESSVFWPIYKKYEYDLSRLNDQRVQLVKDYTDRFATLTDADAKQMAEKSFDLESQKLDLKKKYYKEFSEKLPSTTVAKFFQLEHRLDLLIDLQVAAALPSLLVKSPPSSTSR
jgi:hypothetical protein